MISGSLLGGQPEQWLSVSDATLLRLLLALCALVAVAIAVLAWSIRDLSELRATAERARQLQAEFLANVSHEIRTPLNGVLGTADLLLDTVDDPETREQIETIRESALGQLELLNQILNQSKIDSGVLLLEMTPFSPRRIVQQVERTFATAAGRKGIRLPTRIPLKWRHWCKAVVCGSARCWKRWPNANAARLTQC